MKDHPLDGHDETIYRTDTRMVKYSKPLDRITIYVDSSWIDQNSTLDTHCRRAGCTVVIGTEQPRDVARGRPSFCFQLEDFGADREYHTPTSNRAELRAAVAALEYRMWSWEGWTIVTIASDSTYVVDGISDWIVQWKELGWRKRNGENPANMDLWQRLLRLVNEQAQCGCEVRFWHIGRDFNERADALPKKAAELQRTHEYQQISLSRLEQQDAESGKYQTSRGR